MSSSFLRLIEIIMPIRSDKKNDKPFRDTFFQINQDQIDEIIVQIVLPRIQINIPPMQPLNFNFLLFPRLDIDQINREAPQQL